VPAAGGQALHLGAPADVQRPHALGPVELVGGEGEEIGAHGFNINRDLAHRLHGIGMQVNVSIRCQPAHLFQGLNSSDLIVGMHYGYEYGVRADGPLQLGQLDQALTVYGQVGHGEALPLQAVAGLQNGRMLDLAGDDVPARIAVFVGYAPQS